MQVHIQNDGPVTIELESPKAESTNNTQHKNKNSKAKNDASRTTNLGTNSTLQN